MGTESGESQAEILRKRRQQRILRSKEDRLKSIKQSFAIPDGDETGMHSPNPIDLEKVRNATSESVHQIEKEKNEEVKHKVKETKEVGESRSKSVDKIKKSDTRAAKLDKSTRNAESEQVYSDSVVHQRKFSVNNAYREILSLSPLLVSVLFFSVRLLFYSNFEKISDFADTVRRYSTGGPDLYFDTSDFNFYVFGYVIALEVGLSALYLVGFRQTTPVGLMIKLGANLLGKLVDDFALLTFFIFASSFFVTVLY